MDRYAAALSEHPVAVQAVGEIAGDLLEQLAGARPDLVVVFVSPHFAGASEDVAAVFRAVLHPRVLLGAGFAAVVGRGREVEDTPAISAWAAAFESTTVHAVTLDARPGERGVEIVGLPADLDAAHTLLLLADPFSFPAEVVLAGLTRRAPGLRAVGGLASAGSGPGTNRLIGGENVRDRGAVGVLLGGDDPVGTVVSQGCRPVGRPFAVTATDGAHVVSLGGRPALERLEELAEAMDDESREQLRTGLYLGIVVDEHRAEFDRGDFLVRSVVGAREEDGALTIGATVELGQTVQFQVRDAATADADLRDALAGRQADAALLFTCSGRGRRLFQQADHDALAVRDLVGPVPLAGAFCAGEIGPVGGVNFVHGFSASVALFGGAGRGR